MAPENETGVLAVLLVLAAALYAVTWSIAGPSAYPEAAAAVSPVGHVPSIEVAPELASLIPAPQ